MKKYLKLVSEALLKEKRSVLFYGVSTIAISLIKTLRREYNIAPVCLCDGDQNKWEKSVEGVEILGPEEAFRRYPDAYLLITSRVYKHQIIGRLTEQEGVPRERILNFEPVVYKRSCVYLESMILALNHRFYLCDTWFNNASPPYIDFKGDYNTAIQRYLELKDEITRELEAGRPTKCGNCPYIREDYYPAEEKVRIFNHSEGGICNFKCAYCNIPAKTAKCLDPADMDCGRLFRELEAHGLLSDELTVDVTCGEVAVHPLRERIYEGLKDAFYVATCTNAAVYDARIAQFLSEGRGSINVSMDAGTRETFCKIKGFDLYARVCDHLKRYSETGGVIELKYIVLPGINDSDADIDGFSELCRQVRADLVSITYDLTQPPESLLNERTMSAMKRLTKSLQQNGLLYKFYFYIADAIESALVESAPSGLADYGTQK